MSDESALFQSLLEKQINLEEWKQWFQDPSSGPPKAISEAFERDVSQIEAFRLEMPLLLLNFIREQSSKILMTSQNCSQTPSKANHPSKYDYDSPIKSFRPDPASTQSEKRGHKKRVQLFASPLKEVKNTLPQVQEASSVDIRDELIKLKLTDPNETKIAFLEERFSAAKNPKLPPGQNSENKFGHFNSNKKGSRRSLDSAITGGRQAHPITPHGNHQRGSSGSLNLGDFIVTSNSRSGGRSKGKNKNRRSDSALLEQNRESPMSCSPLPSMRTEGTPELSVVDPSPSTNTLRGTVLNFDSSPEKEVSKTPEQNPRPTIVETNDEPSDEQAFKTPLKSVLKSSSPVEPQPLQIKRREIIEDDILEDEDGSPTKQISRPDFDRADSFTDFIEPDPSKVNFASTLSQLASLYSFFIDRHLVPNVLVELYLLLELLTLKARDEEEIHGFFSSVHNGVFFAVEVLKHQVGLLQYTDALTLKYLLANPRLDSFCPELKKKLNAFLVGIGKQQLKQASGVNQQLQSVRFQTETDAKENFPTMLTFQDFREQRDLFYDILRDWQHQVNSSENSSSHDIFLPRVSKLLCLQTHPVNMLHFAKLFQSQLLCMSIAELNSPDLNAANSVAESEMLNKLRSLDPMKWRKLQARIFMPSRFGGPCPLPDFPGCQEFFRDFIRSCGGHHMFLTHLKSTFVSAIIDLNERTAAENQFQSPSGMSETQYSLTPEGTVPSDEIYNSILSLRILAKFLGFIESFAFQYPPDSFSDKLLEPNLKYRQKEVPCIDLISQLKKSQKEGNLVITIPWIIEYCSVLDSNTVKLPYYQQLFARLLAIYRNDLTQQVETVKKVQRSESINTTTDEEGDDSAMLSRQPINAFNAFFLTIHMGWFFEGTLFPRELFIQKSYVGKQQTETKKEFRVGLDSSPCLTPNILYTCCPYVNELKVILSQFETGFKAHRTQVTEHSRSGSETRDKRLYSANVSRPSKVRARNPSEVTREKTSSELQAELEENFFHNQSNSVKKCVEIVAELVASKITRIIAKDLITGEVSKVTKELQSNVNVFLTELTDTEMAETVKEELMSQVIAFSDKSYKTVKQRINEVMSAKVVSCCATPVQLLLPEDTNPTVAQMCVAVAQKKAVLLIKKRVKENVTRDYFKKEYSREFEKFWKSALKRAGILEGTVKEATMPNIHLRDEDKHCQDIFSCDILIKLKEQTVGLLETWGQVQVIDEPVLEMLSRLEIALANEVTFYEGDISDLELTLRGLESLSVDWTIALCAFSPSSLTPDVQDTLIGIWGGPRPSSYDRTHFSLSQPPPQLMSILSPRNLTILGRSRKPIDTWSRFENLLIRLLKAQLILPVVLEDQSIRILKSNWPKEVLCRLSSCLNGVVSSLKSRPDFDQHFLDWTVWFYSELTDDFEDDEDSFPPL